MITTIEEYNNASVGAQQRAVSEFIGSYVQCCETTLVDYVLKQSHEDDNAPLHHDDITNNNPTGSITLNGCTVEITAEERDEKLERYEYLRDKADEAHKRGLAQLLTLAGEDETGYENRLDLFERRVTRLIDSCQELEDLDFYDYPEIYEWWSCDRWLLARLEENGQCTLAGEYWGRCTTGQSIFLDRVILEIYKERF
jgi:hypothetical protein